MANFHLIRDLCEKNKITIRELALRIGKKENTIQAIVKNGSTNTTTIEEIAAVLNVPVGYFFDDMPISNQSIANGNGSASSIYGNVTGGMIADKDKEIEHLKALLEEKERTIQILMDKNKK